MVKLKRNLESILNNKNYNLIIFLLIGVLFIFLICGNYNLVEGLKLDEISSQLNNKRSETNDGGNLQKNIAKLYNRENGKRKNLLDTDLGTMVKPKNVVEGFLEGMNKCSSNFSNVGVKGNKANLMVNSQCESLEHLKNKNKSVINGAHEKKLNYY